MKIAIVKNYETERYDVVDSRKESYFFDNYYSNRNICYYGILSDIDSDDVAILDYSYRMFNKFCQLLNNPVADCKSVKEEIKSFSLIYNEISKRRKFGYPNDTYSAVSAEFKQKGWL